MSHDSFVFDEFYEERLKKGGTGAEGVGYRDELAQTRRFDQLVKIVDTPSDFSLNDIGCGLGHFWDYLLGMEYSDFRYIGYDVSEMMLERARNRLKEPRGCSFHYLQAGGSPEKADFTVASGIFNLKGSAKEADWLDYILSTLNIMDRASGRGFAFNMLTKYSDQDRMEDELYYSDPCYFFDICKQNYSRNVALLHDYEEYDFTILVRK